MISIYDSRTRRLVPLTPLKPGHVRIYTCGITPYDHSHLGHARPAVVWDVIRRHLRRRGYLVTFVQNFTDIDDKIIQRAEASGESAGAVADRYIEEYRRFMRRLRVRPPDYEPRVTQHIAPIIEYIQALIAANAAYVADGDVYFRVRLDPEYGTLSGRTLDDMVEGARVAVEPGKEYAGDFALWKKARPGEPSWESPWGPGRPGWHIECSVMSHCYLGPQFDLHGGGLDLIFPHHENERAQSRAYSHQEPVAVWVHSGLITRGAVKMSKSLNNGVTLAELFDRYDPAVVRLYLLSVHYRSPLDYDERHLAEWQTAVDRLVRLWHEVKEAPPPGAVVQEDWAQSLTHFEERFLGDLDEDFNTARALGAVFDMVKAAYRAFARGYRDWASGVARRNLLVANEILDFLPQVESHDGDGDGAAVVRALVQARDEARSRRDYGLADALRRVLVDAGYEVLDTKDGTRVRRRVSI
ncbi:MAG: cysteine--tRNA ligase [Firmicutes bacterium]|nr:cysteine--tRNA ligase [Bacillota bacterium]